MKNNNDHELDDYWNEIAGESGPQHHDRPLLADPAHEIGDGVEHSALASSAPAPSASGSSKLSKHRTRIKMLEEDLETYKSIWATTRAINMEIFDTIQKRAIDEICIDDPEFESWITLPQIIDHFVSAVRNGQYSKSAYARYRSALLSEMNIQLRALRDGQEIQEFRNAIDVLSHRSHTAKAMFTGDKAASAVQPKRKSAEHKIGRADYKTLIKGLEKRGPHAVGTLFWVKATFATGLRPVEWSQSKLDEGGKLHTRRAKAHRHIPAFERMIMARNMTGEDPKHVYEADEWIINEIGAVPVDRIDKWRTLELEGDELDVVRRHMENVSREKMKSEDGFEKYKHSCTKYLNRICKSIWKNEKHYSFYSFRHQFAANAKRVNSLGEVKRELGSNSASKYARRSQSWRGLTPAGNQQKEQNEAGQQGEDEYLAFGM